jgi:hypothetical protein
MIVGWGATAVDGFPGLRRVAFEERNPTPTLVLLGCAALKRSYPTEGNPPGAYAPQPTIILN